MYLDTDINWDKVKDVNKMCLVCELDKREGISICDGNHVFAYFPDDVEWGLVHFTKNGTVWVFGVCPDSLVMIKRGE